MNKLIVENTYRSLLIFMLNDPAWKKCDYVLINGRISDEFITRFKTKVNSVIVKNDFPVISLKSIFSSILTRIHFTRKIKKYDEIYGNLYELKLRKAKARLIQLDDGLMTKKILCGEYQQKSKFLAFRNNLLFRFLLNINYDVDIRKFSFLVPQAYEKVISFNNCKFINVNKMINKISEPCYQEICEVFGFFPRKLKGKNILMLQPFFEDGLVSSIDYEISMYEYILRSEGLKEEDLYIKPHPRSSVEYNKYFKKAEFIPKDFPYELLVRSSNGNKFEKVISIHSSGLEEFIPITCEVVCFGTENFHELDHIPMTRW